MTDQKLEACALDTRRLRAVTREQLAATRLLAGLPASALDALADRVVRRTFRSGEVLCEAGSVGLSAFVVVGGRFRAQTALGAPIGDIGRGELIGEMSLLTGDPRTATVVAVRDSQTLELDREVFNDVLASHPACYQAVSRQLVERLQRVLTTSPGTGRSVVLTMVTDRSPLARVTIESFLELLGRRAAVVRDQGVDLARLEAEHQLVVLLPPDGDRAARLRAFGQSDRVLHVVDAAQGPQRSSLDAGAPFPAGEPFPAGARFELVLVHPGNTRCPVATTRWLDALTPVAHHHVRAGHTADLGRLDRRLHGRETVLVLSGGGARGLAHAGLYRALLECGVGIDAVAGVSAGAVAAAIVGMGLDWQEAEATSRRLFCEGGTPIDLTVPAVALAAGRRMNQRLKDLCGEDRMLEDLWIPTRVISTNLSTLDVHVHERGLLWRALRASTAIPGVFPPVPEPEGLMVDGGLVSNLPVELVRQHFPGATVIASDVGRRLELLPDAFPYEAEVGGWQAMRARLRHRKLPGLVRILAQLTALGGVGSLPMRGDVHLDFDLSGFGIFDFKKADAIIDAGYRQSRPTIAAFADQMAAHPAARTTARTTARTAVLP